MACGPNVKLPLVSRSYVIVTGVYIQSAPAFNRCGPKEAVKISCRCP